MTDTTLWSHRPQPGEGEPTDAGAYRKGSEPIPPVSAPANWNKEYDVIVVGSGWGGLTATLYLAQHGKTVALLEKAPIIGGASVHANFNHMNPGGSKAQTKKGFFWPKKLPNGQKLNHFDPKQAAAGFQRHYQYSFEERLLLRSMEQGGKWADWMTEQDGVHWKNNGFFFADENSYTVGGKYNVLMANWDTGQALAKDAQQLGADILTNTKVTALVADGQRVIGVKSNNKYYKANDGVILTAGGFGANLDMLEKYIPSGYKYATQGGPTPEHTGEVTRMGLGMGADISGYNSFSMWADGLNEYWGDGNGKYVNYLMEPVKDLVYNPYLRVDKDGNILPFFGSQANFDRSPFGDPEESAIATVMASSDHHGRMIMDADYQKYLPKFQKVVYNGDYRFNPLENYKHSAPGHNRYVAYPNLDDDMRAKIKRGAVKVANSLTELASMIGMKPQDLLEAVHAWNEMCKKGEDDLDTIPYEKDWLTPISKPPYYGIVFGGQIGKTLAGLRINDKMQVINTKHQVIPGLYAGWTTAGGAAGENAFAGQFGRPAIFGAVSTSGVGGFMCAKSVLGEFDQKPVSYQEPATIGDEDLTDEYFTRNNDHEVAYKDGTYIGSGQAMGGKINVKLNISNNRIKVEKIYPNHETAGIGGREAIADGTFARKIEAAQGADIDVVSGASVTTNGIKEATKDALKKAQK